MNIQKKISIWVEKGLLSKAQADSILEFENSQPSRSWVMMGVAGIGVVALMTGVVSVIAANWDIIPEFIKLALYFLLQTTLGLACSQKANTPGVVREVLFTCFSVLFLGGIGLVGQIYNLGSDGWEGLLFWLAITLPVTLLAESRLINHIWVIGFYTTLFVWFFSKASYSYKHSEHYLLYALSVVYFAIALTFFAYRKISPFFYSAFRSWGVLMLLGFGGVLANTMWASRYYPDSGEFSGLSISLAWASLLLATLAAVSQKTSFNKGVSIAIALTLVATGMNIIPAFANATDRESQEILGAVLFSLPWCGLATAAALGDQQRLFDFAALVIGLRFIVVYFEVFGSLAATGVGLILSGLVILGVAFAWHKYRAKIATIIKGYV